MLSWHPNLAMNAHFELSDYQLVDAAQVTDGFVVNRWYADFTGDGTDCGPGTTGTATALQNETGDFRSRACINVNVDASDFSGSDNLLIRQRIAFNTRMERQTHHLRVWALGPEDGGFDIALSGSGIPRTKGRMVTRGDTDLTMAEIEPVFIRDLSTSYITLELFTNPADMDAFYQICAVQHETLRDGQRTGGELIYSPQSIERLRCAPYSWLPGNPPAVARSSSTIAVKIDLPIPMSGNPSVVATPSNTVFKRDDNSGLITASGPTFTPALNARGGLVIVDGFTGLPTSGIQTGQLVSPAPFLVEAEL